MIKELEITCLDIDQTFTFYSEVLELQPLPLPPCRVAFQIGDTRLIFQKTIASQCCYHFAIDIPHNKLLEAFQWLRAKVPVLKITGNNQFANFPEWNAQSFYFFDNNGNLLELICRCDLPNGSNHSFSAHSFLRISEIGLVTDNVMALVQQLEEHKELRPFAKQKPAENFAALGDELGLLIIVAKGRKWFPSNIAAQPNFTRVVISRSEVEGQIEVIIPAMH